jgi:acyl-CoA reductase-like NAD-dependent aldehyde dehydrogenase
MNLNPDRLFIGGVWAAPSSDRRIQIVSPSTEETIGSAPEAAPADVDAAATAARRAFDDPAGWASWDAAARAAALDRLADALESRGEELARTVSMQNGMPIAVAQQLEAAYPVAVLRYYGELIRQLPMSERRDGLFGGSILVERRPVGVIGAVVPWNFPQALTALKLAPALAAGCTLVLKPSPETVLDSHLLADCVADAGIPAGVVNVVPGGSELGAYLIAHPGIDKVAFTGSTAAGREIAKRCGQLLRPLTLELGGKSAAIVLDDADLTNAAEDLFGATLLNSGQTCFLGTRVLAPRSRYHEVVELFTELAAGATVGDPLDSQTQVGPLVSARQRARVEHYIATGRSEGARVTTGGGRPEHLDTGWFVEPTVFADVRNDQTIAREEIFGPVLALIAYEHEDEAVAIANDSSYGLAGTVWSNDPERALSVARRVLTGSIGVNHYLPDPVAPYGGVKDSGIGRELGPEGLAAYQHLQSIYIRGDS